MPARTRIPNTGRATTSGRRACSRISPTDGKIKWGFQYTPNDPYDYRRDLRAPDHQRQGERRGPQARGARRAQRLLLRARPHQRLVRRRQAIRRPAELDDRPRSQDRPAAQLRSQHGRPDLRAGQPRHARPSRTSDTLCPSHFGGKNWEPSAYNPELGLLYIPSIEGCNIIETVEQKDFVDQGGTVKPRERFTGGSAKTTERLYGSLKAVDPTTGETKASLKLDLSELSAARSRPPAISSSSATTTARFTAYDAKTLQELWSFNIGTGINAPPITYAVNGKQYVAVLVGSRQALNVWQHAPELKNTSTASMLFVFDSSDRRSHTTCTPARIRAGVSSR